MSNENILEEKIQQTEKRMNEFAILLKNFDDTIEQFMNDLNIDYDQLKAFGEKQELYSPEMWDELQKEKKIWDERLKLLLDNVPDPNKAKKTLADRGNVQPHWLFVR